ncbi:hypothetical protein KUCAC02_001282, partial [Chaenocephalus aceratus]
SSACKTFANSSASAPHPSTSWGVKGTTLVSPHVPRRPISPPDCQAANLRPVMGRVQEGVRRKTESRARGEGTREERLFDMSVSERVSRILGFKRKSAHLYPAGGTEKGRDGGLVRREETGFDVVIRKLQCVTAPRKTAPSDSQRGRKKIRRVRGVTRIRMAERGTEVLARRGRGEEASTTAVRDTRTIASRADTTPPVTVKQPIPYEPPIVLIAVRLSHSLPQRVTDVSSDNGAKVNPS